jgi:capsule synthesis protein PGA_cap
MIIRTVRAAIDRTGWEWDAPGPYFSQPYTWREALAWVANNLVGPSDRHCGLSPEIESGTMANPIAPELTVGFVGDIMPWGAVQLRVADEVRAFFAGVDFLAGNLEGTIVTGRAPHVFMGLAHTDAVLDLLAELHPPERTVLSCANNHAADYGWALFRRSYEMVRERGFVPIGLADEAIAILGGKVAIAASTAWSNRPCAYVARLGELAEGLLAKEGPPFCILCPHWGYELQAYPHPRQIAEAQRLLGRWGMIVGHHSHCPQPVSLYGPLTGGERRLVAYSLGNFTFGLNLQKHLRGVVVKVALGPGPDGRWRVGRVDWQRVAVRFMGRSRAVVTLAEAQSSRSAAGRRFEGRALPFNRV